MNNHPAEIFGYYVGNSSLEASEVRKAHWCPFTDKVCNKSSRLLDFPFGVCTTAHGDTFYTICPRRFEEKGTIEGIPRVLENVALHYFGNLANLVLFSEIKLPNVGSIDFVLVRHKPMKVTTSSLLSFNLIQQRGQGLLSRVSKILWLA
jgi:hypothetical protein